MSRLILYADESGTMPLHDNDSPFVAAIVAARSPLLIDNQRPRGISAFVARAVASGAVPFFAYVLPVPGYAMAVQRKYAKLDLMTRARGLLEKKAVWAWAPGAPIRNFVWAQAMLNAIAQLFIRQQAAFALAEVLVIFDRKTLAPETRELFRLMVRRMPHTVNEVLTNLPQLPSSAQRVIRDRFDLAPTNITMLWSDECDEDDVGVGLRVAHHFARCFHRHLLGRDGGEFEIALSHSGLALTSINFTPTMMRPMDRTFIQEWRAITGLPEPDC